YSFENDGAFHTSLSMNSTFAQVGLGSPDLEALHLLLCGQTPGSPDKAQSGTFPVANGVVIDEGLVPIPADGNSKGGVKVIVRDAHGNTVSGQSVSIAANSANVNISPSSALSDTDGVALFTVTDLTPETVTFTATANGTTLDQKRA